MGMLESSPVVSTTTDSTDAKNTAMVMWLMSSVLGVIAGLLFAFMQRSEPYVQAQAKECMNWGITVLVVLIVGAIVFSASIMPFIAIANVLFALMGAIATSTGLSFSVPLKLRLLK